MKASKTSFNLLLLALLLGFSGRGFAQGVIKFDQDVYTFDAILEGEQATHDFVFTNTGDKPIVINHVQPGCGCTTPSWTKDPVLPGQKGVITATYNSTGRPGPFTKTISVTSNAKPSSLMLTFRGVVLKKAETPSAEQLATAPVVNLDKTTFVLGKLAVKQKAINRLKITNTGKSPLSIEDVQSGCLCISYKAEKNTIAPGESTTLDLTFTGMNLGKVDEKVYLKTNDPKTPYAKLVMKVEVVEELVASPMMKTEGSGFKF